MNKKELAVGAATTIASLMVALPAAALSVNGATNAAANADGQAGLGARVGNVINAVTGVASSGVSVGASGTATVGNGSSTDGNVGVDAQANLGASAGANAGAPVMVTRADVENNTVTAASADASNVRSDADLSGFIAAQIKADTNVDAVQSTQDSVAVTYKVPAKLLGLFNVNVDATAVVNADGSVTVKNPWYGFLLSTNEKINAHVESVVQNVLGAQAGGQLSGMASTTTSGNAMQSGNASATGTANAQGSAQANTHASAQALSNAATRAKLIADIRAALAAEANASSTTSVSQ